MPNDKGKKTKKSKEKSSKGIIETGTLAYVDYVGRTKEEGTIFDLTMEDVAKEEGLYKEDGTYEPLLVCIGWNWLLTALEEELVGMKVGESKTVEIPPEKGAGPKDPKKIKLIAKTKLAKQGVRPIQGEEIKFGKERGIITQVLGRRVRVDFNSPLAGKTLIFDVTVREIISEPEEKILAVIKRRIPALPQDQYSVSIEKKIITIELPKESRYLQDVQYAEIGIAADALKVIEDAEKVKMIITYERPEPPQASENDENEDG